MSQSRSEAGCWGGARSSPHSQHHLCCCGCRPSMAVSCGLAWGLGLGLIRGGRLLAHIALGRAEHEGDKSGVYGVWSSATQNDDDGRFPTSKPGQESIRSTAPSAPIPRMLSAIQGLIDQGSMPGLWIDRSIGSRNQRAASIAFWPSVGGGGVDGIIIIAVLPFVHSIPHTGSTSHPQSQHPTPNTQHLDTRQPEEQPVFAHRMARSASRSRSPAAAGSKR